MVGHARRATLGGASPLDHNWGQTRMHPGSRWPNLSLTNKNSCGATPPHNPGLNKPVMRSRVLWIFLIPPDFVVSSEGRKNQEDGSPDFPILCRDQSSTAGEHRDPSMGKKSSCVPLAREAPYRA